MVELEFKFIDFVPVSTNDMYVPSSTRYGRKGKRHHFLHKSDALKRWQESISKSFEEEFFYTKEYLRNVSSYINGMRLGFNLELMISMPIDEYYTSDDELTRKDASNYVKSIEDSIFMGIGVDDKRDISVQVQKGYNEDGVWYIYAKLTERSIHNRIDVDINKAYIKREEKE